MGPGGECCDKSDDGPGCDTERDDGSVVLNTEIKGH